MLNSIFDAVKGQVVSHLTQQIGLQAGQAEQAVPLAKESITGAMSSGNVGGLLGKAGDLLGGEDANGNNGGGLGGMLGDLMQ